MKRKLKIDDLTIASFATEENDLAGARGTVRGAAGETVSFESMVVPQSCVYPCPVTRNACSIIDTCAFTCDDYTCKRTDVPALCG